MSSLVRKCGALFLAFFILCSGISATAAENRSVDADDNNIYEVLARSNMRAAPSIEGAWIMTIPQGAVVRCLGTDDTEFCEIVYEGVTGYIYSGCIRRMINAPSVVEEAAPVERSNHQTESIVNEYNHSTILGSVTGLGGLTNTFSSEQTTIQTMEELRVEVLVNANLRGGPSIETSRLTTVPEGTEVTFLDEGENGFTHISYQGQTGYIYSKLLDLEKAMAFDSGIASSITTPEMQNSGGRNNNGVALMAQRGILSNRNDASTPIAVEISEVAAVSNMIEVQPIISSAAAQTEVTARSSGTVAGGMEYEVRSRANMRTSPSVEGGLITTLPVGADVISLGETAGGYTMVQYNGITGYVLEDVLVDRVDISKLGSEPVLFTVTAYCSCKICCGNYSPEVTGRESRTSTGAIPKQGRTLSVDPTVIPYGSSVHIDGVGDFIAEDCGGGVKQNHVEIYFESHEEALVFGSRRLYVSINSQ